MKKFSTREPIRLLFPALLAAGLILLPLLALLFRAPWGSLTEILGDGPVLTAMWLSIRTATVATLISVVFGVPLAWVLARSNLRGTAILRAFVALPMVLPPVVGGVALLTLLGRRGLLGQYLETWFGVTIPFTTSAVVIAQVFVAMPFLVLSVDGSLRARDTRLEDIAATFGANRWQAFRKITIPMTLPAIGAGSVLAFARSLGEFGATITFAGNYPGTTQTMPTAIYLAMESDPEVAIAMSVILVSISAFVLIILRSHWLTAFGSGK